MLLQLLPEHCSKKMAKLKKVSQPKKENKKTEQVLVPELKQPVSVVEIAITSPVKETLPEKVQTLPVAPKKKLPEGVIKVDIVTLNSKKYKKTFRVDGTTQMELLD